MVGKSGLSALFKLVNTTFSWMVQLTVRECSWISSNLYFQYSKEYPGILRRIFGRNKTVKSWQASLKYVNWLYCTKFDFLAPFFLIGCPNYFFGFDDNYVQGVI